MVSTPARPAPRKNPRQARSRITVDAIVEAATRIFSARGYARSSTNLIAIEAGVSVGSLYQYFPDKLSLLAAARDRHLATMMAGMTEVCRREAPAGLEPALRAIIETAVAHHAGRATLIRAFALHLPREEQKPARTASADFQLAMRDLLSAHRSHLRIADHDLALFMLRTLGRSLLQAAAESRPRDLANGTMSRELLASALAFLTGERAGRK